MSDRIATTTTIKTNNETGSNNLNAHLNVKNIEIYIVN